MMPPLQSPKNGFSSSNLNGHGRLNYVDRDAQITRTIESFYLLSKSIVSKVSEVEPRRKKLILLVDEPQTLQLIDEFLQKASQNFEIQTAATSEDAINIANSVAPDLIITDWLLPEHRRLELIRKLKTNPASRETPMIMITGLVTSTDEWDSILQTGAFDYLRKPLVYGELRARVKAALSFGDSLKEIRLQKETIHIKNQFVNFLFEAAPNPIFYQDKRGHFMGCNNKFERFFNKTKAEIIGKRAADFLSREIAEVMEMYLASAMESDGIRKFDMELSRDEGNQRLRFTFAGFGSYTAEGVIGSITDVPEIIQLSRDTLTRLAITHQKEKDEMTINVEKLLSELDFKHREVAMHLELLIHSRNVKEKLVEGVNRLQPFLTNEGKSKLTMLLKQLKWEINEEVDLNIEKKFDETNAVLYTLLEKRCPEITKNEKRLCAFLKMNHGASDIAKITDKSLNSINVALARLRAKLQLPNTKDLRVYLNEFDHSGRGRFVCHGQ